ncbi:hypothetical protein [Streptomyces sp. LN785]|uniref:hypothetical protein n=1 Tax=Streptomyces sp. LN785 TaxID=3112983 RepID=UPI0037104B1D
MAAVPASIAAHARGLYRFLRVLDHIVADVRACESAVQSVQDLVAFSFAGNVAIHSSARTRTWSGSARWRPTSTSSYVLGGKRRMTRHLTRIWLETLNWSRQHRSTRPLAWGLFMERVTRIELAP